MYIIKAIYIMKIIDNKKDYYDYISGINGIDSDIVYDRRNSIVITTDILSNFKEFFSEVPNYNDKPRTSKRVWRVNEKGKGHFCTVLQGLKVHYAIRIGKIAYIFEVERYLDDNSSLVFITNLVHKTEINNLPNNACPVSLYTRIRYYEYTSDVNEKFRINLESEVCNPILRDTQIPRFISPEEIYNGIYNYLISIREKPIIDKRTDVQKLESQGFDKKTSFRNVK